MRASVTYACGFTGKETTLDGCSLVPVTARLPHNAVAPRAGGAAAGLGRRRASRSVTLIGDALAPGTIAAAVWAGRRYAEEFDEDLGPVAKDMRREVTGLAAGPSTGSANWLRRNDPAARHSSPVEPRQRLTHREDGGMTVEKVETLIIGGGQAGLAMSGHLGKRGMPHLVLERHRIAERWRSERWDSLVANGPAWHDRFPDLDIRVRSTRLPSPRATRSSSYFEDLRRSRSQPRSAAGVEVTALSPQGRRHGSAPRRRRA